MRCQTYSKYNTTVINIIHFASKCTNPDKNNGVIVHNIKIPVISRVFENRDIITELSFEKHPNARLITERIP